MRQRLRLGASLLLAGGTLALFLWVVGPRRLAADLAGVHAGWALLAGALGVAGFLAWGASLRRLFAGVDSVVPARRFHRAFLAGVFAKQLLPGGNASGPAFIAYAVNRETDDRYEHDFAVATVGELFNLAASVALAAVGVAVVAARGGTPGLVAVAGAVGLVAVAVVVGAVLLFVRRDAFDALVLRASAVLRATAGRASLRVAAETDPAVVRERLDAFGRPLAALSRDRAAVAVAVGYSAAGWTCLCLALWASAVALGHAVPLAAVLFVVPVGGVASAVPLPGGLGGVEVATTALLVAVAGLPLVDGTAAVLLFRLASFWLVVVLGGLATVSISLDPREVPQPAAAPDATAVEERT